MYTAAACWSIPGGMIVGANLWPFASRASACSERAELERFIGGSSLVFIFLLFPVVVAASTIFQEEVYRSLCRFHKKHV